jgi:hypothetical protein
VFPQAELRRPEAEEPHCTFVENALAKARHAARLPPACRRWPTTPACASRRSAARPALLGALCRRTEIRCAQQREAAGRLADNVADRRAHYVCVACWCWCATPTTRSPLIAEGEWHGEILARRAARRLRLRPAVLVPEYRPDRRRARRAKEEPPARIAAQAMAAQLLAGNGLSPHAAGRDHRRSFRLRPLYRRPPVPGWSPPPPLALYVHWPWCVKKCPYCDFNSHESQSEHRRGRPTWRR